MEYYSFILIILYVSALLILFAITIMMNKENVIIVKQIKWSYLFLLLYFLPFNTEDILMLYDNKYSIIEQIGLNIFSEYFSLLIVLFIFIILLFVLFTILLLI